MDSRAFPLALFRTLFMTGFFQPLVSLSPLLAEVDRKAVPLFGNQGGLLSFITNSCLVAAIVLGVILWLARKATTNMQLVPHPTQNFFEFVVESLYVRLEGIIGPKVAPRAFPLLATLFVFILTANWFGLIPGVGTIGWGEGHGFLSLDEVDKPLFRPATADLNMTLGMALVFMVIWTIITIRETGVWQFLVHLFGPKGGLKGFMGMLLAVIFFGVGIIEVISILIRPVSLSLRLYGNVYAGETLLHTMMTLADKLPFPLSTVGHIVFPLPFYFMELLVGLVQALVFTLLCAVYIQLSTAHEEHGDAHH
jgi:F-type H+-transporting ATPase subunit a